MSIGGKSLHKKDYLQLALLGGGAMTGLGAAGIGPLAGLFANGGLAGTALGGAAELASVGEAAGMGAPAVTGATGLLGMGKGAIKGLDALQKANALVALAQGPQGQQMMAQQRPQPAMPMHGDAMKLWQQIYGGTA